MFQKLLGNCEEASSHLTFKEAFERSWEKIYLFYLLSPDHTLKIVQDRGTVD